MKNISIFLPSISRKNGGASTIIDLALRLKKLEYKVSINSVLGHLDPHIYRPKYFDSKDFDISSFPLEHLSNKKINFFKKLLNRFLKYRSLEDDNDLIIDACILSSDALDLYKKNNTKIFLNHAGSPAAFQKYFLQTSTYDEYLQFCSSYDGLIFQSQKQLATYLSFEKKFMKEQKFFCCVPPANELMVRDVLLEKKEIDNKIKKIVCVGSIQKRKNQSQLISFASELIKHRNDFKFLIVGNVLDKSYLKELEEKIILKNLQKNISILGFRNDYLEIINDAYLIIHPSKEEGVSRVIREGMALGKMIIAYDLEGTMDLISRNDQIKICKDQNEMLFALKSALQNLNEVKSFEENASLRYWNDLSEENFNKKLIHFLNDFS